MTIFRFKEIKMIEKQMTFGEKACGVTFNPSNDDMVQKLKQAFADLVDTCDDLRLKSNNSEEKRMLSLAITDLQTAQMWSVKAVTWKY
jgi:hypothetical protein